MRNSCDEVAFGHISETQRHFLQKIVGSCDANALLNFAESIDAEHHQRNALCPGPLPFNSSFELRDELNAIGQLRQRVEICQPLHPSLGSPPLLIRAMSNNAKG